MSNSSLYEISCGMLCVLSKDQTAVRLAEGFGMFTREFMEKVPEDQLLNYAGAMSQWLQCFAEGAKDADRKGGVTPERAVKLDNILKGLLHSAATDYFKTREVKTLGFIDPISPEYFQDILEAPVSAALASKEVVGRDVTDSFFEGLNPEEDGFAGVLVALTDARRQMNIYLDPPPNRERPVPVHAFCSACCSLALIALQELDRRSPLSEEQKENIIAEVEQQYATDVADSTALN